MQVTRKAHEVHRGEGKAPSGDEFTSGFFGIDDPILAMTVFRDSMYKNKPKIIAQEVMCNARDAHRELGNPSQPIRVILPSDDSRVFGVRDFGIGISPERMSKVFLNYFSSTKRGDDIQTGGFGLGAKSPFSYADSFTIVTFLPSDSPTGPFTIWGGGGGAQRMIRREYLAYLDESGAGKIDRVKQSPTPEPRGTLISIPLDPGDENTFAKYVCETACFWSVPPEIAGARRWGAYPESQPAWLIENAVDGWKLAAGKGWTAPSGIVVLLDEIAYEIDPDDIRDMPMDLRDMAKLGIYLEFETGEVMPAATREALNFTTMTSEAIITRLEKMRLFLSRMVRKRLGKCTTLMEASMLWFFELKRLWFYSAAPTWRGHPFVPKSVEAPDGVRIYTVEHGKAELPLMRRQTKLTLYRDGDKTTPSVGTYIFNDLPTKEPSRYRLATAMDQIGSTNIQVIHCEEPHSADNDIDAKLTMDEALKLMRLNVTDVTPLSRYKVLRSVRKTRATPFRSLSVGGKPGGSLHKDIEGGSGIYVLLLAGRAYGKNGLDIDPRRLRRVLEYAPKSGRVTSAVSGILIRSQKRIGDRWIHLTDWAKKRLERIKLRYPTVYTWDEEVWVGELSKRIGAACRGSRLHRYLKALEHARSGQMKEVYHEVLWLTIFLSDEFEIDEHDTEILESVADGDWDEGASRVPKIVEEATGIKIESVDAEQVTTTYPMLEDYPLHSQAKRANALTYIHQTDAMASFTAGAKALRRIK